MAIKAIFSGMGKNFDATIITSLPQKASSVQAQKRQARRQELACKRHLQMLKTTLSDVVIRSLDAKAGGASQGH